MSGGRPDPTRIGQARPSQLTFTAGVGAVIDLPGMSVVIRGLDAWGAGGLPIVEPRLLAQVQRRLPGANVSSLRAAPFDPDASDDPYTRVGVPVTTFPRWLRCPACHQLLPIDGVDQLQLQHRWGRRPDLAKWVHTHCPRQSATAVTRRRACFPARFLVACPSGHLDEFPYVDYVHQAGARACPGPQLEMRDAGSVLGPRVTIQCTACGASRNISNAAGAKGAANLPRCRGRHPHLQTFSACPEPLKLMVLGASNMWFGVTVSALHLPQDDPVVAAITNNWTVLGSLPSADVLASVVAGMPALHAIRHLNGDELWTLVEAERQRRLTEPAEPEVASLLDAEWELLSHPTTTAQDDDFRAVPTPTPSNHSGLLRQVVQVERLREVQATVGFTRIGAPVRNENPTNVAPLSIGRPGWVPAVEQRGEGIFLEFNEGPVAAWAAETESHPHIAALRSAYARWRRNRDLAPDPTFPFPRFLLVHTFSHLLLRQVALECGYSSASIRERIYVGTPDNPMAGVLLSTAASDSEGTLGGLVALGEAKFLGRLLDQALREAETCSSDPLCAERVPENHSDLLHIAACHACLFASETSCESGNRWLHRGVLVDMGDKLAFGS